jgi:2-polyprenyl-3-methyl-5-hydroxy-6-metoxy-1,4-benzoquinol methylase
MSPEIVARKCSRGRKTRTELDLTSKYETEVDLENKNSSHTLIVELVGYDKHVLDLGASTGYLAKALAEHGCRVTGIEIDPEAARQAEAHCERMIVGDIESLDLDAELDEESFDVIVFGDVLEHLKDPLQALRHFKPFVHSEGYVVASIPNIAHGSVRLALMQGRFPYRPLGLLDNTHLRFFTRETVEQLFKDAGFLIVELRHTTRGIFDTEIKVDIEKLPAEVLRLVEEDPEASTYQFVLSAYRFGEAGMLAQNVRLLSEQLARRERVIYELNRRLRNLEELQRLLDARTEQLAEKEREVTRLAKELAERNDRLARLVQFGKEDP